MKLKYINYIMNFSRLFGYKQTAIRLIVSMIVLLSVRIDNVSNYGDITVALGGTIVGSVIAEIILRTIFYIVIKK